MLRTVEVGESLEENTLSYNDINMAQPKRDCGMSAQRFISAISGIWILASFTLISGISGISAKSAISASETNVTNPQIKH